MYTYALSLNYRHAEDPKWFEAVRKSKVRKFEFGAVGSDPPEAYAKAVDAICEAADTFGVEAASVHIPFGETPWVPARTSECAETLAAIRGLMKAWAPLHPPRFTLHGGSEADKAIPHAEQIRALRAFLAEILPDVESAGTSLNIEYLPRTCLGNTPDELEEIVDGFPPDRIGICLDVNHASPRTAIMPELIRRLGPRINSFHLSDTDGVDDWPACMAEIRSLSRDTLLILEVNRLPFPSWQSAWHHNDLSGDLAAMERNVLFLENAEEFTRRRNALRIP